ncbi:MAG: hypothetical protein WDW38_000169 [Sanguina aurantia]
MTTQFPGNDSPPSPPHNPAAPAPPPMVRTAAANKAGDPTYIPPSHDFPAGTAVHKDSPSGSSPPKPASRAGPDSRAATEFRPFSGLDGGSSNKYGSSNGGDMDLMDFIEAMTPVPSETTKSVGFRGFQEIGRLARDVVYGSPTDGGRFALDNRLNITSRTASGVTYCASAAGTGAAAPNMTLAAIYSARGWGGSGVLTSSGVTEFEAHVLGGDHGSEPGAEVQRHRHRPAKDAPAEGWTAHGNMVTATGVSVEYSSPWLNLKSNVIATNSPFATMSVALAHQQMALGAEATYDHLQPSNSAKTWTVGGGWHTPDGQLGLFLTQGGSVARVLAGVRLTPDLSLGAEVSKNVKDAASQPFYQVAASLRVPGINGPASPSGLAKLRVAGNGNLEILYQDRLAHTTAPGAGPAAPSSIGPRLSVTMQANMFDITRPPKVGFSMEL